MAMFYVSHHPHHVICTFFVTTGDDVPLSNTDLLTSLKGTKDKFVTWLVGASEFLLSFGSL